MRPQDVTIVVLGAGINGAAIARECALSGVSVVVADAADVASGATSWSTRLVHGGLRYLEYGEIDLVRESLAERDRLIRVAPHLVKPLKFLLPLKRSRGGLLASAARIVGFEKLAKSLQGDGGRGAWAVRAGLSLYDVLSTDSKWPRHSVVRDLAHWPGIDRSIFPIAMSYVDAQMVAPERFTIELLSDARSACASHGSRFELWNHHLARLEGNRVILEPTASLGTQSRSQRKEVRADAVINATGAWVDRTLETLPLQSPLLIGGTKGSHLVLRSQELYEALQGCGIYAEALDDRPVFVLPFLNGLTLVGTTDVPFFGDPTEAKADDDEITYLLSAVARLFPRIALGRESLEQHYCGVRPLPSGRQSINGKLLAPASVTRRHMLIRHQNAPLPCWSVVGGKLTTCRSLGEQAASKILKTLGVAVTGCSRDRPLPGAQGLTGDQGVWQAEEFLVRKTGLSRVAAGRMIGLYGSQAIDRMGNHPFQLCKMIDGTTLPLSTVSHALNQEWAHTLEDVVERRLLLLFEPVLHRKSLLSVANEMVSIGRLAEESLEQTVNTLTQRFLRRYGKRVIV